MKHSVQALYVRQLSHVFDRVHNAASFLLLEYIYNTIKKVIGSHSLQSQKEVECYLLQLMHAHETFL